MTDDRLVEHTDVLVVDADDANRATLCRSLAETGFSHACVRSSAEALDTLTTSAFTVALLDSSLTDADGVETLRRRMRAMTPPGIIVIVGGDTPHSALSALKTHAYDLVAAPVQADLLREVIQGALTSGSATHPIDVLCAELKRVELLVPCARETVERAVRFINQIDSDLDVDARDTLGLAFRELLLNAVEWGGKLDATQRVRVVRMRAGGLLVYRITDPGPGFRFDDLPHAAGAHAHESAIAHMDVRDKAGMRAGGFGLMLVRALADVLMYNERGNEVTFVKYLAPAEYIGRPSSLSR